MLMIKVNDQSQSAQKWVWGVKEGYVSTPSTCGSSLRLDSHELSMACILSMLYHLLSMYSLYNEMT